MVSFYGHAEGKTRTWPRKKNSALVLALIGSIVWAPFSSHAQLPKQSSAGNEILARSFSEPEKPEIGKSLLWNGAVVKEAPSGVDNKKDPTAQYVPYFHLGSDGKKGQRYVVELHRPVKKGEHLRFSFWARLKEGARVHFGIGSNDGGVPSEGGELTCFVSLRADGRVVYSDGAQEIPIEGLSHKPGQWKNYSLDYVVGSDQLLITAGTDQYTADAPFSALPGALNSVERIFISSGLESGKGDFSRLEAYSLAEESTKNLPVFGRINWTRSEIPMIQPGPRGGISGFGFVATDDRLFLIGGYIPAGDDTPEKGNRTSRWVLAYDINSKEWTRIADLPDRREYGSAVAHGDEIFYFGGAKQTPYTVVPDVFSLNVAEENAPWQKLPPLSIARSHSAGGVIDGKLIVAGGNEYDDKVKGYGPSTIRDLVEALDLKAVDQGWKRLSSIPEPARGWSAFATVGEKLYLFGGMTFLPKGTGRINQRLQSTIAYSPKEDKWETLEAPPFAVSAARAAVYKDRYIILFGGTYISPLDRIYRWNAESFVFDTKDNKWFRFEKSTAPPGGVYNDPGMAVVENKIFIAGGEAIHAHYNSLMIGEIEEYPQMNDSKK